jgi:hypothetical protein
LSLHPDFPVIEGRYRLTRDWELELPGKFNRRMEDGDMVIWRPGLTFWIAVWGAKPDTTPEGTLARILEGASPDRTDENVDRSGDLIRLTYRLREQDPDRDPEDYVSMSAYVIARSGYVQIAAYCDTSEAESAAGNVLASIRLLPEGA